MLTALVLRRLNIQDLDDEASLEPNQIGPILYTWQIHICIKNIQNIYIHTFHLQPSNIFLGLPCQGAKRNKEKSCWQYIDSVADTIPCNFFWWIKVFYSHNVYSWIIEYILPWTVHQCTRQIWEVSATKTNTLIPCSLL